MTRVLLGLALALCLTACAGSVPATIVATDTPAVQATTLHTAPATTIATRTTVAGTPVTANCAVSPYATAPPTGSAGDRDIAGLRGYEWYGGDGLWAFPWVAPDPPGTLTLDAAGFHKVLWWREPGVQGTIAVTARRLDGPTAPIAVDFEGSPSQQGQQPGGLHFPTPGCWEITGTVGGKRLTFVALVVKAGSSPATPALYPTLPLPAACDAAAIRRVVGEFIAAFNAGDHAGLARVFPATGSDGDHPWTGDPDQLRWFTLTRADPGTGVDALNLSTRDTILAYFAARHAQHERMRLVELVINPAGGGPVTAAINFVITRTADDLPESPFGGKGGVGCTHGLIFLWSQGGPPGSRTTPTP